MDDIQKSYYTIGEVSALLGEAPSLIRFWETEFPQLKPYKTDKGTRKYSHKDIELLQLIHHLVKEKGYTLEGAKEALRNEQKVTDKAELISKLKAVRGFLTEWKDRL